MIYGSTRVIHVWSQLSASFILLFCSTLYAGARQAPPLRVLRLDAATSRVTIISRAAKDSMPLTFLDSSNATSLLVVNRKFLTSYSFFITGTKAAIPPPIRDLDEATNLTLGTATLIPQSKGDVGTVSAQNASNVFLQLLDESGADAVNTQLEVDFRQMRLDSASLQLRLDALRCQDALLFGALPLGSLPGCTSNGSPNLLATLTLLQAEVNWGVGSGDPPAGRLGMPPFVGNGPFVTGETDFAQMNVWIQGRLNDVKAMQTAITQADLATTANRLDASITQFEKNSDQFQANARAIRYAVALYNQLGPTARQNLTREYFKTRIPGLLKAQPTDPALSIDPGELNTLVDAFLQSRLSKGNVAASAAQLNALAVNAQSRSNDVSGLLTGESRSGILIHSPAPEIPNAPPPAATLLRGASTLGGTGFAAVEFHLANTIPDIIAHINLLQSQMVARANFIYDNSRIAIAQSVQIDLTKSPGNQYVYYLIQYNDGYPRYVVQTPVITPSTSVALVGTPLPPPVVTQPVAPSTPTQTSAALTPVPTPITTPVAGQVPITGHFEVHEFQSAAVIAAVTISSIRDNSYGTQSLYFDGTSAHPFPTIGPCVPTVASTTTGGVTTTTTTATSCYSSYLSGSGLQPQAMIGIMYYPRLHDSFFTAPYSFTRDSGFVAGISANTASTFFLGVATEPHVGLNIGGGIEFGSESRLQPSILALNETTSTTAPTYTRRINKPYVSIGLDLNIFRKVFGKVLGLGTSSTAAPGE